MEEIVSIMFKFLYFSIKLLNTYYNVLVLVFLNFLEETYDLLTGRDIGETPNPRGEMHANRNLDLIPK